MSDSVDDRGGARADDAQVAAPVATLPCGERAQVDPETSSAAPGAGADLAQGATEPVESPLPDRADSEEDDLSFAGLLDGELGSAEGSDQDAAGERDRTSPRLPAPDDSASQGPGLLQVATVAMESDLREALIAASAAPPAAPAPRAWNRPGPDEEGLLRVATVTYEAKIAQALVATASEERARSRSSGQAESVKPTPRTGAWRDDIVTVSMEDKLMAALDEPKDPTARARATPAGGSRGRWVEAAATVHLADRVSAALEATAPTDHGPESDDGLGLVDDKTIEQTFAHDVGADGPDEWGSEPTELDATPLGLQAGQKSRPEVQVRVSTEKLPQVPLPSPRRRRLLPILVAVGVILTVGGLVLWLLRALG